MKKPFIISLLAVFLTACTVSNNNYVLKINNEEIGIKEYMVYLYEQKKIFEEKGGEDIWEMSFDGISAQEVAKQNAADSVIIVKTAKKQAEELNIFLNEDDNAKISDETKKLYSEMGDFAAKNEITEKDIRKTVEESYLQEKVFDFVTDGYEISDADFEMYFDNYCEENKSSLKKITVRYICKKCDTSDSKNEEEIEKIYEKLIVGESFTEIQQSYSDGSKNAQELDKSDLPENIKEIAYGINEGEMSSIITEPDGYYILKVEKIETADTEELAKKVKELYISDKKKEIYNNQSEIWCRDINVEKNEELWSEIVLESPES